MRGRTALAAALSLGALAGCGYSSAQEIKERDPPGGQDQGPDVHNRMVDDLRTVEILLAARRFQPAQTSVGLDSTVRLFNNSNRPVRVYLIKRLGRRLRDTTLAPGERVEREYLRGGVEVFGMRGSRARLEINVFPSP